ncbi:DUF4429 domain-containing protein [Streptomyces sp. R302]|uniref:DUF4429 domain-containing protein n=1 Tax=unclassified Streptomyces TaxID=2593676 RepID=UPI00145F2CC4|nr:MULTISPECIES: DUF4429 domain-containing protein [unclassified Streptomyces]NML49310.1 DUF4429 domain-containing protein [Streptomyces sp. R301]NML77637.1 DUF4429 domain-containing protein [Streptomyces sp. R302]
MGDVLAGIHATWEFESDALVIRFERGIRTPRLFQALRERRVPYEALSAATLAPGRRGTVVLHAVPRPGADPLMEAAAGQLKETCDPYRLALPADREELASRLRDELAAVIPGGPSHPVDPLDRLDPLDRPDPLDRLDPLDRSDPSDPFDPLDRFDSGFLVAAPQGPVSFKAYDGKATFDGTSEVTFRWSSTMATSEKWKTGDQVFPVRELSGVEWRSPDSPGGFLRLLPRGGAPRPERPDHDPASVVFGLGYGPVHDSLPFAAAVLAAIRAKDRAPVPAGARSAAHGDPGAIAERIRHLGELHRAGLVTDEEFAAKKTELLAEL